MHYPTFEQEPCASDGAMIPRVISRVVVSVNFASTLVAEIIARRMRDNQFEHRIEPKQRVIGGICPKVLGLLFRRKQRDDFLKARIAAERVPAG